jgi:hypothetical protein
MEHRKQGARLLGLLVVMALGVMTFAASAQAVAPGFLINKKPVGALLATGVAVQVGVSTMLVPGLNFELNCTTFTVDQGVLESNTDAFVSGLNTGCTLLSISKLPEEIDCHVEEPIKSEALLLPAELTNGEPAVLLENIKGSVVLHLKGTPALKEKPCVLPLTNMVTGDTCAAIANNDTAKPLVFTNASVECKVKTALNGGTEGSGTVKDILKYGAQTVTVDGTAHLSLTGAHAGLALGVSLY